MKTLSIIALLLMTLSSCGQALPSDKQQTPDKPTSPEASAVYQNMTSDICNCTQRTMKNNKPSTTMDSCYNVIVSKNTATLQALGYDPASPLGQNKLLNEIRLYQCRELYNLFQKELADEQAKKLLFKGVIVSQKQLSNGEVEVVMTDSKTKEKRIFKSKTFLSDPTETDKNTLNYEMTVEYEVKRNARTKQDEYYIKDGGQVMTIGVQKVGS